MPRRLVDRDLGPSIRGRGAAAWLCRLMLRRSGLLDPLDPGGAASAFCRPHHGRPPLPDRTPAWSRAPADSGAMTRKSFFSLRPGRSHSIWRPGIRAVWVDSTTVSRSIDRLSHWRATQDPRTRPVNGLPPRCSVRTAAQPARVRLRENLLDLAIPSLNCGGEIVRRLAVPRGGSFRRARRRQLRSRLAAGSYSHRPGGPASFPRLSAPRPRSRSARPHGDLVAARIAPVRCCAIGAGLRSHPTGALAGGHEGRRSSRVSTACTPGSARAAACLTWRMIAWAARAAHEGGLRCRAGGYRRRTALAAQQGFVFPQGSLDALSGGSPRASSVAAIAENFATDKTRYIVHTCPNPAGQSRPAVTTARLDLAPSRRAKCPARSRRSPPAATFDPGEAGCHPRLSRRCRGQG